MKNPEHIALLSQFGLNEQEARVYLSLLEMGTATIGEIAIKSGIKRTSIYNFIDRLVEMGVITHGISSRKRSYQAVDPEEVLRRQEARINLLKDKIGELTAIAQQANEKPRITYYQGAAQMRLILTEQLRCHSNSLAIWPRKMMLSVFGGEAALEAHNEARVKAKIFVRTILISEETAELSPSTQALNEIRYARPGVSSPMGILVLDTGKVAFISSGNEMFGFIIESQDLYLSMRFLFETLWMQTELR